MLRVKPPRTTMCDHRISKQVQRSNQGPKDPSMEPSFACEAYAQHGVQLHNLLVLVVECAECADHVLVHTFLETPAKEGAQPTFAQLVRVALAFACGASDEGTRKGMQVRIRTWYLDAQFERSSEALIKVVR